MSGAPAVTVVLLNHRSAALARRAMAALEREAEAADRARVRLVVVDNASRDDSDAVLRAAVAQAAWAGRAVYRGLPVNLGYGAGNNAGAAAAAELGWPADVFLFLNPDCFVEPGCVGRLAATILEHPARGIAGAGLRAPDGGIRCAAFRFPGPLAEFAEGARRPLGDPAWRRFMITDLMASTPHPTDWVSGACLAVRADLFRRLGGFDERFFLYFEEADLCRRARRAGFATWYEPRAAAVHLAGGSTGAMRDEDGAVARPPAWHRSRALYFRKHHGPIGLLAADLLRLAGIAAWRSRVRRHGLVDPDPPEAYRAYFEHSVFAPRRPR